MSFKLVIEGDTIQGLRTALSQACVAFDRAGITGVPASEGAGEPEAATPVETGKRGRGRPPKAAEEAPAKSAADMAADLGLEPAPAPAAAPAAKKYTFDEVKAALQEIAKHRTGDADETSGLGRVTTILAKIGVKMVKEIPETMYAQVIELARQS